MNGKSPDIKELEKAFDNDLDLVLFFLSWIKNGRNAQKAYQEIHPNVTFASAGVLGSRMLKKVRIDAVLETYGIGIESYFNQIAEGHKATKWNDFTGEREADHKTRKDYNDKIGKLLGIEQDKGISVNNDVKILVMPTELIKKYDLPSNPSDSS